MENKNFFESWLETQKKMIGNWNSAAQKMQQAVAGGEIEKGSEIYKEWLNSQTEIVNEAKIQSTEAASKASSNTSEKAADFYNNWLETQKKNTEKLMEYNQQIFKPYADMAKKTFGAEKNDFSNMQESWTEGYKTWLQNWSKPFAGMIGSVNNGTSKDAFSNMLDTTNTYFKMYEIWAPFYKAMGNKQFAPANFSSFFNADKFKELMDDSLKFISPAPLKDAMEQANSWMENVSNFSKHMFSGFNSQWGEMSKNFPANFFGQANPLTEQLESLKRSFKLMTPGKETEMSEMYMSVLDLISKYSIKTNELQYLIYTTGQKTLEQMLTESVEDMTKSADASNYSAFFQKWVEKSDQAFIDLFKTDEYSKLQGELIELGVEIKEKTEKMSEAMLAPYPVVLRSEADDLHKTIYDLKKRIKDLERLVKVEDSQETEKKSPKNLKNKVETV